jgi:phosphoribosylpyrophosphate synthetase
MICIYEFLILFKKCYKLLDNSCIASIISTNRYMEFYILTHTPKYNKLWVYIYGYSAIKRLCKEQKVHYVTKY